LPDELSENFYCLRDVALFLMFKCSGVMEETITGIRFEHYLDHF
jgi:hypothetical protein